MTHANEHTPNPLAQMEIDYNSGLPVWIQIKNRVSYLIASGEYAPGDRLPTVRSLAVDLDISYNTVNRAYIDLERDGLINTRKGRGTFVAQTPVPASEQADKTIEILADELIQAARNFGMAEQDILDYVQKRMKRS